MIGNPNDPIIKLGKSIITNLKIEVFDYKYKDGKMEEIDKILQNDDDKTSSGISAIDNLLKGKDGKTPSRVPT
jgi:hypothetical protein